jgi:hypothetical protein
MLLKKEYDQDQVAAWNKAGRPEDKRPVPTHVTVKRPTQEMHFNQGFLDRELANGILSIGGGKLTFKTADGEPDLVYRIVSPPGIYCCHCSASLGSEQEARTHVAEKHAGKKSPDLKPCGAGISGNPAGYRQDNFYTCVLEG